MKEWAQKVDGGEKRHFNSRPDMLLRFELGNMVAGKQRAEVVLNHDMIKCMDENCCCLFHQVCDLMFVIL